MSVDVRAPYKSRVKQALRDESLRVALDRATGRLAAEREQAMTEVDGQRLRAGARAAREASIRNLPDLLEQLEQNLSANGVKVHWARDAAEANSQILEIARAARARRVVKSKSMVTEEIELNSFLERHDIEVVETDLGEYIIQLAGEPPSHITAPVIHKRVEDISELFQRELDMTPTHDPAELCATARRALRTKFLAADMGISGCNFAIAETGSICIVTNEGNGRMVTSLPRVYVAIAGIEKVLASPEHAVLLWQAASRSATGQAVSVYFTVSSGPRAQGHADGPEEMHVVLLDNGRSRMIERGYADAALCIRCGACINVCPVYQEIGGHAYGPTPYSGPIGAVITPLLADDPASARDLPFASTLCGACRDACPVEIDLPRLLLDLRSDLTEKGGESIFERLAIRAYANTVRRPRRYEISVRVARWLLRLIPSRQGTIRRLPAPLSAWTRSRDFPRPPRLGFRDLWRRRRTSSRHGSDS